MDWTTFDKIVNTLEDPVNHLAVVEKDIIMNGKTITTDVEEALESWRAGEYTKFGQQFGNALYFATEDNLFLF